MVDAVHKGIKQAVKGHLTDEEIIALVGHSVDVDIDDLVKENDHTSYKRAIWISNIEYRALLVQQIKE